MRLFDWFNAREATQFGHAMAAYLAERLPKAEAAPGKKADKKRAEALVGLFAQAERFRLSHKPNLFKKAKLGNAFKWSLLDLGYEKDFVDEVTKELLLRL